MEELDVASIKNILVVRLDAIGDVVLTSPLIRELRRLFPDAFISLVVNPETYNLVEKCPHVNEVLTFDRKVRAPFGRLIRQWRALKLARKSLWKRKFDLAILPRWDADHYHGAWLCRMSGAKWRIGYAQSGKSRLFTHLIPGDGIKHEVERNLDIVKFLGGKVAHDKLETWIADEDESFAVNALKKHGAAAGDLLIAIGPGAGSIGRRWPVERFGEICKTASERHRAKPVVIGGQADEILGDELRGRLKSIINMAGKTSLRQTTALLKRCRLFIGNDSGPMHLAAAAGIPVVEISAHPKGGDPSTPDSPVRFHPWGVCSAVIQPESPVAPCNETCKANEPHCILSVSIGEVTAAMESMAGAG